MMVEGFCDADWASQKHRHSISRFSFHFGVGAISWSSKKQGVMSLLRFEEEKKNHSPSHVTIKEPSCWQRTINSKDEAHRSTISFHCEAVEDGKTQVKYIPTDDNVSDIFTKPLLRPKFTKFVESLGLRRSDDIKAKHRC